MVANGAQVFCQPLIPFYNMKIEESRITHFAGKGTLIKAPLTEEYTREYS